ncbi:MAG: GspE/PulE family protein [Candidatus Hydrogenedentota bacterium]
MDGQIKTEPAARANRTQLDQIGERVNAILAEGEQGVVDAVDCILQTAADLRASDIHFEPWDEAISLRFRLDGLLHEAARLPKSCQERLMARIKVLARMAVYHKHMPQDGRIDPDRSKCGCAFRVAAFPTIYGEKVSLRLLGEQDRPLNLGELGLPQTVTDTLRQLVGRASGVVLLTGPSSSGKTTTIYALLRALMADRETPPHVVTIEDPVEYRLGNVAQTQIGPPTELTFATALRSLLRQDPEVIVVGEIRDAETAHMAIQAGLTGHLVISTIHCGTAAGVFTRLLDMGIEPFLVASSLTGVLAQRLVRRVCEACAEPYQPDSHLLTALGLSSGDGYRRGRGCPACQGIGYKGRTALGELLLVDDALSEAVLAWKRTRVLHGIAMDSGMHPLVRDGLDKARAGVTALEEIARVLPPEVKHPKREEARENGRYE